ncbi:MAG: IclR family transcriptional regulator [Burkholderiales bacterium]|nr:IclR family transcriptional regulator [Burkholderiales bacterium]
MDQPPLSFPAAHKQPRSPDEVAALARGLLVLRAVADMPGPVGNSEIAALTGIPKATVSRLAATLVKAELLKQLPDSELFALGAGALDLGNAYLRGFDLRLRIKPYLTSLAEVATSAVHVGVLEGLDVVLIETVRPRSAMMQARLDVGMRMDLLTSAIGRGYLSGLPDDEQAALIAQASEAKTRNRAERKRLKEAALHALDAARSTGYAMSLGEWHPDLNGIAAPFRGPRGERYAVSCGGPAFLLTEARLVGKLAAPLLACIKKIQLETRSAPGR